MRPSGACSGALTGLIFRAFAAARSRSRGGRTLIRQPMSVSASAVSPFSVVTEAAIAAIRASASR